MLSQPCINVSRILLFESSTTRKMLSLIVPLELYTLFERVTKRADITINACNFCKLTGLQQSITPFKLYKVETSYRYIKWMLFCLAVLSNDFQVAKFIRYGYTLSNVQQNSQYTYNLCNFKPISCRKLYRLILL